MPRVKPAAAKNLPKFRQGKDGPVRHAVGPDGKRRAGAPNVLRDDYAMPAIHKRALELYTDHAMPQRKVAVKIAEEFNLKEVPTHASVQEWIRKALGTDESSRDTAAASFKERASMMLEGLTEKFYPIATRAMLSVSRKVKVDGFEVEVIDENGIREQAGAAKVVLRVIEVGAKLHGIDKPEQSSGGASAGTNTLIINLAQPNGESNRVGQPLGLLKISAGDPIYDAIESHEPEREVIEGEFCDADIEISTHEPES